ncbi:RHS repeat-associated core domain-containing protein, partial [Winogradskyella sp.]
PKSEAHTAQPDATELSELCYQYKYDHRNRLVEKKIPGKGWESIIYNRLDQPVMTQDKELKNANKWLVTKYDVFGRVVYTGIKNTNGSRTDFQNLLNNNNVDYETKESVGTGYMNTYYTSNSFPVSLDEIHTINYYDNYYFDLRGGISETAYGVTPITNVKGLATGGKVRVLGTNDWITTVTYYDEKSRPIYVYSKNDYLGSIDKIKSELTFDGTVLETTSSHNKNFPIINVTDKYTHDHMNRLILHTQLLNNAALPEVISENEYDDLGQLVKKGVGDKENVTSRLQDVDYEYNIRGWLKRINKVNELEGDLFSFEIEYNTPSQSGADGLFNGNISQINWQTENDEVLYSYVYEYDALNRIKGAGFYGQNSNNRYNLSNITYDKNGNILSLTRNGHVVASPDRNIGSHFGVMDQLTYTYETSSNQLKKVDDSANTTYGFKDGSNTIIEYTYDDNGNMLTDANKGITSISYNHLNLPTSLSLSGGNITYIYDATGVKQKKIVSTGTTTEYAGNYIYENGTLKMFSHAEGYVEPVTLGRVSEFNYVYQYKDHLGNVRLTYMDKNQNNKSIPVLEIIEENNYYPFGLKHKGYNNVVSANVNSVASKYKTYQGQEFTDDFGLNIHEWKYRVSDPALGRFWQVDPLSEGYEWQSVYAFGSNQPIHANEIEGLESEDDKNLNNRTGSGIPDSVKRIQTKFNSPIVKTIDNTANAIKDSSKEAGKLVLRYGTPVEDIYGIITGEDFDGQEYNRAEAGAWAVVGIIPGAKLGKLSKLLKTGKAKKFSKLGDLSKLDGAGRESLEAITNKINNIGGDHLKAEDITGAILDISGNPVLKESGEAWQHLKEVNEALDGLGNQLEKLNKLIDSGDLGEDVLKAAKSLRTQVQGQKDQIQNLLNKAYKEVGESGN